MWERNINRFPPVHTQNGDQTRDLSVHGQQSNPLSHLARAHIPTLHAMLQETCFRESLVLAHSEALCHLNLVVRELSIHGSVSSPPGVLPLLIAGALTPSGKFRACPQVPDTPPIWVRQETQARRRGRASASPPRLWNTRLPGGWKRGVLATHMCIPTPSGTRTWKPQVCTLRQRAESVSQQPWDTWEGRVAGPFWRSTEQS